MDKVTYDHLSSAIQTEIQSIGRSSIHWVAGTATVQETILSPVDYDIYKTLRDMQMQLLRLKSTYWQKQWAE